MVKINLKKFRAKSNGIFHANSVNDIEYTVVELEDSAGNEWGYIKLIKADSRIKDSVNIVHLIKTILLDYRIDNI